MSIYTRVFHILLGILSATALVSCGGDKDKSDKTKISLIPEKPIVITADIEQDGSTVAAPWFKFYATITNPTAEPITIVALEVEVTGLNSSGSSTTNKVAFAASSYNRTISVGTTTYDCDYPSFGTIAANSSAQLQLSGSSPCPSGIVGFTVPSNPKPPTGSENYRYTVKVKPLGWFGELTSPTDRYEKKQTFYTQ